MLHLSWNGSAIGAFGDGDGELALSTRGFGVGVSWMVVVIVLVSTTDSAAVDDGGMGVVSVEIGSLLVSPPVSTKQ